MVLRDGLKGFDPFSCNNQMSPGRLEFGYGYAPI